MTSNPLPVYFAPIQGSTDLPYRVIHHNAVGGVDAYYTPFLRWEPGGLRNKDRRDIDPDANIGIPTVVQLIANRRDEFARLLDTVEEAGWRHIDLNAGCAFPMQVHAGRGCALLQRPDALLELFDEMRRRPEVEFSVKMRLGWESADEALTLLPLINDSPVSLVTMHPRIGKRQMKDKPDLDAFGRFLTQCQKPVVYNGDLTSVGDIHRIAELFPAIAGVMIGRGLLANPLLGLAYRDGTAFDEAARMRTLRLMASQLRAAVRQHLANEGQVQQRMQAFWTYQKGLIPKQKYKQLMRE